MKLCLTSLAPLACLALLPAHAADGFITFEGQVQVQTCAVVMASQAVILPTISSRQLDSAGKTAGSTYFDVAVSGCDPSIVALQTLFEAGPTVDTATGRLKNVSYGAANVQLELLNADGSVIDLGGVVLATVQGARRQGVPMVPMLQGAGSQRFIARYYATGPAGPGWVRSNIYVTTLYW